MRIEIETRCSDGVFRIDADLSEDVLWPDDLFPMMKQATMEAQGGIGDHKESTLTIVRANRHQISISCTSRDDFMEKAARIASSEIKRQNTT